MKIDCSQFTRRIFNTGMLLLILVFSLQTENASAVDMDKSRVKKVVASLLYLLCW